MAVPAHAVDYAPLAETAKADFQPLEEADLAAARANLAEKVLATERLLNPATEFGARWLDYLKWEGVQKQLAPDATPDISAAKQTLRMLRSGAEGLERPELRRTAQAIEAFIGVASFAPASAERQTRSFELTVDGLAERLADHEALKTARGSHEAERRLALLASLGSRSRDLLQEANTEFGQPNLFVHIETPLLSRMVARSVDDCTPLKDCILGTAISGTGATRGMLSVATLPAYGHARLEFRLTGSTRSNTVGVNGPVQIRSVGDTTFSASKIVELSDESFRVMPAVASATTRSRTQGVSKIGGGLGSRLVEKIARKKVAEKKGQADAIASSRARGRVADRLNEELAAEIAAARRRYDDGLTQPLRRRGATPRSLLLQTTSDELVTEAILASEGQLAAWEAPPEAVPAPLSVRLHQTAVNNLLNAYLGGATLSRDSVDEPTEMDIVAPPWLKLKAEQPEPGDKFQPWSLRFREDRPISVEFTEGRLKAFLHARQIRVEDKSYDDWDLIATFEARQIDGHWRLVRESDIEVLPTRFDPASGGRLTSAEVGLRNNLADALNNPPDRIPQEIEIDPIDLTSREGPLDYLLLQDLRLSDGWMAAGWLAP